MYAQTRENVKSALKSAARVALTCDSWTSRATESYVTITAHFIDDRWKMNAYVLQTRAMHESHTGAHMAEVLQRAAEEWGLTEKDPVVVTDNASNMTLAVELTGFLHVRCFAHILNLASQRALKLPAVARLLAKIRKISAFFHRSTTAAEALKRNQMMLNLPHHKLITDVAVRWNSAYEMLSRFLEQQPAICAALLSPEVVKSVSDTCTLTEMEISNAEQVVQALKPMLVATNVMCEEKTPTVSVIAPLQTQLLSDMSSTAKDSPLVKELKNAIFQDLSKRYNSSEKSNLYISSALDPRFKSLLFLTPDEMNETFAKVVTKAAALQEAADLMDNRFQSTPPPDQEGSTMSAAEGKIDYTEPGEDLFTVHSPKRRKSALADLLGQTFNSSGTRTSTPSPASIAEQEMKRYQEAPALPLTEDPLEWWKSQAHGYHLLSKLAQRYLCVPGTSVSAERMFSTAGDIISAQRSLLTSKHVDQLLFLKKNMHI
ncbi:hypothetical protein QQF64_036256 [Cirrhinus molitorella]|uniref:HAT C-terminal dimerisation domain-containing protein n=1 Tax=Cirrhinus molitorella TaxID=172907 RepID=A0ABR3NI35_9TELE